MTTQSTTANVFDAIAKNAPKVCPYCGGELKTTSVTVMGKTYTDLPCFGSCGCAKSQEAVNGKVLSERERAILRYREAGIGQRFLDARVENPSWYQTVKGGRGLFITGAIGTGKTYIASAVSMRLLDAGKSVRFETMVGILRQLQDDFNKHASTVLEKCVVCDVLVLDDLGKEKPSEWALSVLYEVVNVRYANQLPIIVTTNYSASELIERLSAGNNSSAEAIVSRLYEMCETVRLTNENRRTA